MRAYSRPMMVQVPGGGGAACLALEAVSLKAGTAGGFYNEAWLQGLIHENPALLPVGAIEPAFEGLVAVAREVRVASGFIDNLLITPEGGICVVETKLWRNPEARRAVIGQILDYAKDLAQLSYGGLEAAVQSARGDKAISLFHAVCGPDVDGDEAGFIDAVSRSLRLGRFLLLIAGDGIQEGAEQLADFLQRHVGLHFTLGLVELGLWRHPSDGSILVQPRVLAKTVQIERAVIRIEGPASGSASATILPYQIETAPSSASRPTSITEEAFFEQLAKAQPSYPARLRAILKAMAPLGIQPEFNRRLGLKWIGPAGESVSLGTIDTVGRIHTSFAQGSAAAIGRTDLCEAYQRGLAELMPGTWLKETPKRSGWYLTEPDALYPLIGPLLDKPDDWVAVAAAYVTALAKALDEAGVPS
ncbi:MAG: hypothetical protein QM698_11460 [Micropepsaceae bacterium]